MKMYELLWPQGFPNHIWILNSSQRIQLENPFKENWSFPKVFYRFIGGSHDAEVASFPYDIISNNYLDINKYIKEQISIIESLIRTDFQDYLGSTINDYKIVIIHRDIFDGKKKEIGVMFSLYSTDRLIHWLD